ncbi:MAG: universal stress protein [Chloroflexi bacterium]|nr:universal stress protein [Chloroflexota bacterium]
MSQESRERRGPARKSATPSGAPRTPTIIVPLDGTTHALAALPVAQALAELEGAMLHVVHVAEPVLPPRELLAKLGLTPERLRGSVIEQEVGAPAAGIVKAAREWQSVLVVMCTHTGLDKARGQLGSVAEATLYDAPCPVALVRPERGLEPWTVRRVLLPHDGTPVSAAAIGPAADLAHRAQAQLDVLHVSAPGAARPVEPGTFAMPRYLDQPQHEWPAWAREFLERLRGLGHLPAARRLHLFLAKGDPGTEVVRFARDHQSDLIVLAWRGHLEAARAATVKAVIGDTPCPVLVVRVEPERVPAATLPSERRAGHRPEQASSA